MAITISNDVTRIFPKYEAISVGSTLTGADSGKVFKVSGSGGTGTLPAPKAAQVPKPNKVPGFVDTEALV